MACRASPARLPPVHSFSLWPVLMASLLRTPERSVGSGNRIPLSLIKMKICTVNEGSNLEAIWPGQVSHQLLLSVVRLGDEGTTTTDHIWPVPREEIFTSKEDTVFRNNLHTSSLGRGSPTSGLFIPPVSACSRPPVWDKMVGSSGIRHLGPKSQPHILSVLPQASL